MTSIEHTETTLNAPNLQTWNNDAYDDGDSNLTSAIVASWSNLPPDESFESDRSKENRIPLSVSSSLKSSLSFTTDPPAKPKTVKVKSDANQRDVDAEIEEVEKEIGRLSTRLESLRLEKAEQTVRSIAIRGRVVPAKFMQSQKQTVKFDDSSFTGSKSRTTTGRGVSLGPGEIFSAAKKSETVTPLQSAQNRRKSCFFKLPGIEEGKVVTKARGRTSLSLSPRSRKAGTMMTAAQKQAVTTGWSKRAVKKEECFLSSIQPKRLFKEEDKNVASRKPLKPGRVVASRYSQMNKTQTAEKDARKRSLSENEEKANYRSEKRRASDENSKSEGRVKKRWEIPSEVDQNYETPIGKELPKIRTLRRAGESPRDSGAAKRVAELESKNRSFTFCQLLRFEE